MIYRVLIMSDGSEKREKDGPLTLPQAWRRKEQMGGLLSRRSLFCPPAPAPNYKRHINEYSIKIDAQGMHMYATKKTNKDNSSYTYVPEAGIEVLSLLSPLRSSFRAPSLFSFFPSKLTIMRQGMVSADFLQTFTHPSHGLRANRPVLPSYYPFTGVQGAIPKQHHGGFPFNSQFGRNFEGGA